MVDGVVGDLGVGFTTAGFLIIVGIFIRGLRTESLAIIFSAGIRLGLIEIFDLIHSVCKIIKLIKPKIIFFIHTPLKLISIREFTLYIIFKSILELIPKFEIA